MEEKAMVREFKLLNEKGQEFSLMDIQNFCLLTDPNGLGYSYETEYQQLGNTFVENLRKLGQGQITGTVNFINYDNYTSFVNFIESSEELKFGYKVPFADGTYIFLMHYFLHLPLAQNFWFYHRERKNAYYYDTHFHWPENPALKQILQELFVHAAQ